MTEEDLKNLIGTDVGVIQKKMRPTRMMFKHLLKSLKITKLDKAYDFFSKVEGGEAIICLSFLSANYSKLLGQYAQKVYNYKRKTLDLARFAKNVIVIENPNFDSLFRSRYEQAEVKYATYMSWKEINVKFSLVVTNPPYAGKAKGGKLYMQMVKAFYDNMIDKSSGKVVAIHPTSAIDGEQDKQFGDLRLDDFIRIDNPSEVFPDAGIASGLGVFIYSKNGGYKLYSDEIKEKNMSEYDLKKWNIYKRIRDGKWKSMGDVNGYVEIRKNPRKAKEHEEMWSLHHCVITPHVSGKESCVSYSPKWLTPIYQWHPELNQHIFPFNSKLEAIKFIKWNLSDISIFILQWAKVNVNNSLSVFKKVPLPPEDWQCDDASVMRYLGLTQEEMDFIHEDVKNKGLKAQMGKTESELMAYIDEINK